MFAKKTILAAAALGALTAAGLGSAGAAPFDHHRGAVVIRHDVHRPYVARARVYETLRLHRYAGIGDPYFFHGRYVVRSHDRFGHTVLVQIDPWTGHYIGVARN
jgi:hypothetical protein